MRYLSVCSGIEAATVAWHGLGWIPVAFSDIEAFPRALLRYHYPHVPVHGRDQLKGEDFGDYADAAGFQTIGADQYGPVELLVGGTPCQSFSVAGKRGGMADGRGNLALEYIRLAHRSRARWVVWENVPGVFSSNHGEDFRCFLSGLVRWDVPLPEEGWQNTGIIAPGPADGAYGVAWRVLDAQYAGVPQRRRRVFVVGYLGDWRRAAAVLLERQSLLGDPPPRRQKGQAVAACLGAGPAANGSSPNVGSGQGNVVADLAPALRAQAHSSHREDTEAFVAQWPVEVAPTMNTAFADKMGLEDQHALGGAGYFVPDVVGAITAKGPGTYGAPEIDAGQIICAAHGQHNAAIDVDLSPTLSCLHEAPYIAHAQEVADPIVCKEGATWTHEGENNFRTRNVIAIQERAICENPDAGPDGAGFRTDDQAYTLEARTVPQAIAFSPLASGAHPPAVAFKTSHFTRGKDGAPAETMSALSADADKGDQDPVIFAASAVRRLTPRECERLQGFPDDYTLVPYRGKPAADGPRYKALGNSMAVPVMAFIGRRIQMVEDLLREINDAS